jgi:hypothetical protein
LRKQRDGTINRQTNDASLAIDPTVTTEDLILLGSHGG